jgi:ABC-type multidrug transport system ATPase subunit
MGASRFEVTADSPAAAAVLEVEGLHKSFRRRLSIHPRVNHVLRGVTFSLPRASVVGLVGENGSGKSVLMKIIVGLMTADSGTVRLDGRLGYCPQVPLLYDKLTCDETFRLFGHAYGLSDLDTQERASEYFELLGFGRFKDELVENLSGGTKQKLNLSVALLHKPDLLLLDEPYSGFDWETYLRFWQLTGSLRDAGTAILIVSHFIEERSHFDKIVNLQDGVIVDETA